jgi:hypothetical protein
MSSLKEKRGWNELCVSSQGFQRNTCEPVYRTGMA